MNWFLKLLGHRDREYRGHDFSVRIEPIMREVVSVIRTRDGASLNLSGERVGKKWEAIAVSIPQEVEAGHLPQIVLDLKTGFEALQYGYVISRHAGVDIVPEPDRQAAIAELWEMGYEIEVSPDRKQISQKPRAGAPRQDIETIRRRTPRMLTLIQRIHGKHQRFEVLAKSKEF